MSLITRTKSNALLIADDSDAIRLLLKETITQGNINKKIIEADNGIDAVKLFMQHRPDLVILDMLMPKADGLQVLRALKKLGGQTKVIITSSSTNISLIEEARNYGVSGLLFKPFTKQHALQIIAQVINQPW